MHSVNAAALIIDFSRSSDENYILEITQTFSACLPESVSRSKRFIPSSLSCRSQKAACPKRRGSS